MVNDETIVYSIYIYIYIYIYCTSSTGAGLYFVRLGLYMSRMWPFVASKLVPCTLNPGYSKSIFYLY